MKVECSKCATTYTYSPEKFVTERGRIVAPLVCWRCYRAQQPKDAQRLESSARNISPQTRATIAAILAYCRPALTAWRAKKRG